MMRMRWVRSVHSVHSVQTTTKNTRVTAHAERDVARLMGDVGVDSGQGVRVERHRARLLESDPVMVDRVKPSFFGIKVEVHVRLYAQKNVRTSDNVAPRYV